MAAVVSGAPPHAIIVLTSRKHIRTRVGTHGVTGHVTPLTPWNRVRFEEQMVAQFKKYPALYVTRIFITVLLRVWDARRCSLVKIYQRFEGTYCLLCHGRRVSQAREEQAACRVSALLKSSAVRDLKSYNFYTVFIRASH
jgi:hypothetical protein